MIPVRPVGSGKQLASNYHVLTAGERQAEPAVRQRALPRAIARLQFSHLHACHAAEKGRLPDPP